MARVEFRRRHETRCREARVELAQQELPGGRTRVGAALFLEVGGPPVVIFDAAAARRVADQLHDAADQLEGS